MACSIGLVNEASMPYPKRPGDDVRRNGRRLSPDERSSKPEQLLEKVLLARSRTALRLRLDPGIVAASIGIAGAGARIGHRHIILEALAAWQTHGLLILQRNLHEVVPDFT